jgi:hypothetical protein
MLYDQGGCLTLSNLTARKVQHHTGRILRMSTMVPEIFEGTHTGTSIATEGVGDLEAQ